MTPILHSSVENPDRVLSVIREDLGGEPIEISSKNPEFDNFWSHVVKGHRAHRTLTIDRVQYNLAYVDNGKIWFFWAWLGEERVYWITPRDLAKTGATYLILSILLKEF